MLFPGQLLDHIPCFVLEMLLAASLDSPIHSLDPINIAGVALTWLSASLRKAIQWNQPPLIVVNDLGKALQPLGCSSATLTLEGLAMCSQCNSLNTVHLHPNPNDSPHFWLKVLSKEGRNFVLKLRKQNRLRWTYIHSILPLLLVSWGLFIFDTICCQSLKMWQMPWAAGEIPGGQY